MSKYKVTQELMNELNKLNETIKDDDAHIDEIQLDDFPALVDDWVFTGKSVLEITNRLIAFMHFINGEDVFEIGKPSYIVQRKEIVSPDGIEYLHIYRDGSLQFVYSSHFATKFDDYMNAREWAGIHFEVVEVDE